MNKRTSPRNGTASEDSDEFRLYNMTEIAKKLRVSKHFIRIVRKAGAPFPLGKSRPEWVLEWLKEHANDEMMLGKIGRH